LPRYPRRPSKATSGLSHGEIVRLKGDRQFESRSLQREVCCEPDFLDQAIIHDYLKAVGHGEDEDGALFRQGGRIIAWSVAVGAAQST
jgi:hypothetical protein